MVTKAVSKTMSKVFGSRNERLLKSYHRRVEEINALESDMRQFEDRDLRAKTDEFRRRVGEGETVRNLLPQVMAVAREMMDRSVGLRNMLNPQFAFDASQLPEDVQGLYHQAKADADQLESKPVQGGESAPGWMQAEIPAKLYDAVRTLYPDSRPPFRARPFDVQLIGGIVLHEGTIAEMKTGEGKTIVAPLACYAACIEGLACHVVTVNDYLVQRDRDWVFPFFYQLGLSVGAIHPMHMQAPEQKAEAYRCDVLYATNNELGFDYLRDNMKLTAEDQVQKRQDFCIVDEIDSILIDEARTPLIISGSAHEDAPRYGLADQIARHLIQKQKEWDGADEKVQANQREHKGLEGDIRNARDKAKANEMRERIKQLEKEYPGLEADRDQYPQYYELEPEKKAAHLTHEGIAEAQKQANIGSFYVGNNIDFPHLLENALRAHTIYTLDKEYVVQGEDIVIVDEFTGRLMVGRQWSDGLHQAVECKEGVKIKEETQTLATVTIQNFFKLYDRLAGMTGTAVTEATEFMEIYKLEVVAIPTNVPVERIDRNDLIYLSEKDKWDSICDEIKRMHDMGRPVLVGTTSVEKSEMLSQMLTKRHRIDHEVLNAKQHERESHIVENAGTLGAVMIATNMAGRGTDIKLRPIARADLLEHWQRRNILPSAAKPEMEGEQIIRLAYRHQAKRELGLKQKEIDELDDTHVRLELLKKWAGEHTFFDLDKLHTQLKNDKITAQAAVEQLEQALDEAPDFSNHRLELFPNAERMGGLHIVGTERHESRRIDNQLRGRSGRQGDRGSSRFFISLEDDLMKMFAGKATLTALSKLGMKEGDAIEHKWVTRSVERAQGKVEERNYEIRKNLLEYDEVMEYQRQYFYGVRQDVLEGNKIREFIFDYIDDAVEDAVETYLAEDYARTQVVEWVRNELDVSVDQAKLHLDDLDDLQQTIRKEAAADIRQQIELTLGEYMSDDMPPEEWDARGLAQWAMQRFSVDLKQNQVRQMNLGQVQQTLTDAAIEQLERRDLSGVARFMEDHYGANQLADWAQQKFELELDPEELDRLGLEQAGQSILDQAHEAYSEREITYPPQFIMDLVVEAIQQDQNWALEQLTAWVKQRYDIDWTAEQLNGKSPDEVFNDLAALQRQYLREGEIENHCRALVSQYQDDMGGLTNVVRRRFDDKVTQADLENVNDLQTTVIEKARAMLRSELTRLERFVLLQILDAAWKDHLYAMDQLKDAVGMRGFAERDPKIEYKREGSNYFGQMQATVRDRVTELIFRARLTPQVQMESAYGEEQQAEHADAETATAAGEAQAPGPASASSGSRGRRGEGGRVSQSAGSDDQQRDLAAADQAGDDESLAERRLSRKQRRANQSKERSGSPSGSKKRKRKSR